MIIKNKIMTIFGLPGSGKTFFALLLASTYIEAGGSCYSNVDFFKNGKLKSKRINHMRDLNGIRIEEKKGIAIIDEGGINISARRSMSDQNMEFLELGMLGRKKNIDIIVISQLERSVDVVMRELCSYTFTMDSRFIGSNYLNFEVEIKGRHDFLIGRKNIDLIKFSNLTGWTYDTTEESIIQKESKKEKEETEKKNVFLKELVF